MSKYRAVKTVVDNIRFDSKKEAARYCELKLLVKADVIRDLRLQVPFEIVPSVIIGGRKQRAVMYKADFVYTENGEQVVEDTKGMRTAEYIIKRKLMKHVYGIEVLET